MSWSCADLVHLFYDENNPAKFCKHLAGEIGISSAALKKVWERELNILGQSFSQRREGVCSWMSRSPKRHRREFLLHNPRRSLNKTGWTIHRGLAIQCPFRKVIQAKLIEVVGKRKHDNLWWLFFDFTLSQRSMRRGRTCSYALA